MGKRKSLTFEVKIKIIEELEKGVPQRDLSVKHGVSKSVIFFFFFFALITCTFTYNNIQYTSIQVFFINKHSK
jgi:hypothetical protein